MGSYFIAGDFVTRVATSESIAVEEFIWFKFMAFTLLGGVALLLSLKIMKKIKELSPISVIAYEQKNKSNISLYRFFNLPNLISITVFVLRVFTDF